MNRTPSDDFVSPRAETYRRRALRFAQRAFFRTGADLVYSSLSRTRGIAVVLYHSVPDDETARFIDPANRMDRELFEREMEFLARKRRTLSIEALAGVLSGELPAEPGSVVVTLDDGYRDNFTFVAPLLESLGIPAILYLPTRLVARGDSPWADKLYTAFRYRTENSLNLPTLRSKPYALDVLAERRAAYAALVAKLIETDLATREELLDRALRALAPTETPPRLLLDWNEVREMKRRHPWLKLGVHGAEHLDMTSQPDETLKDELEGCTRDFEAELGEPALHFAYPYNRSNDRSRSAVARHGLRTAMTSGADCLLTASSDPLDMARLDAPKDLDLLGHWTSGAHPRLSRKLFRRS
jgi:peptidoglycan/xylan/chitin deacetylase (PgdA/CDA1 family)